MFSVCLFTGGPPPTGGTPPGDKKNGQSFGQKMDKILDKKWTKNWTNILETFGGGGGRGGRGRYASCGHVGGLSCSWDAGSKKITNKQLISTF